MRFIPKSATLQDFTLFVSSFSAVGNKPPFQTFQKAEKKRTRWGLKQWQLRKEIPVSTWDWDQQEDSVDHEATSSYHIDWKVILDNGLKW